MAASVHSQPGGQVPNVEKNRLRPMEYDSALARPNGPGSGELSEYEAIRAELTLEDRSDNSWPCLVWSVAPGYVRVTMAVSIPGDAKVTVRFHGGRFTGSVAHCVADDDRFRVGIRLTRENGEGNRRDPRFPVHSLGLLTLVGSASIVREEIEITDVSATGLGVRIRSALEPGGVVMIELQAGAAFGEVRHCEPESGGWSRVGIALGDCAKPYCVASQFVWKLRKRFGP